jgi:predicted DNA-binding transcriptional regulator YafY
MKRSSTSSRRRPAVHITLGRAARLHRLVMFLAASPRSREAVLSELGIGLRTFYRELELLKRCGVKIQQKNKAYKLLATAEQAEGRLPFPDPQLSFAEMAELARSNGDAGRRLAELLASVINSPPPSPRGTRGRAGRAARSRARE